MNLIEGFETTSKHIGLPPDENGNQDKQRDLSFDECHLNDSIFVKCNLSNVEIKDWEIDGMTVDGKLVTDLLKFYEEYNRSHLYGRAGKSWREVVTSQES